MKQQPYQRLKHERERRGWSQAKVAEELGIDSTTMSRWERGISLPYPYYREKLCVLYGKNAHELGLVPNEVIDPSARSSSRLEEHQLFLSSETTLLYDPLIPSPSLGVTGLVGRETLLRSLKQRVCSGNTSELTALTGLPGVGKTALAVHLAHDKEVLSCFPDGVLWVGLGPQPHVQGHLSRWGTLLKVPSPHMAGKWSEDAWAMTLRSAIRTRCMLLIIDDAWTAEAALAFRVGGPFCSYLVTTRFPQVASQVATYDVLAVHELREDEGCMLIAHFTPELVARERTTVQALVRLVGGLPLALTLMGKWS